MKKLYLENGFFNYKAVRDYGMPFNFVVGGRGTGKTYGALKDAVDNKRKFIFMRRTNSILEEILNGQLNPLNPIARDEKFEYLMQKLPHSKYVSGFYRAVTNDDAKLIPMDDDPMGVAVGLSIMGNMRGWDAYDYTDIIVDEFIPAPFEKPFAKNEADAFFNAYETINRNREFEGKPPVTVFLLANSNSLTNDYFIDLHLVDAIDKMQQRKEDFYIDKNKGVTVTMLEDSPISARKQETALYRLTAGTEYADMALGNEFVSDRHKATKSVPLVEYTPIVKIGELVIYQHKIRDEYYACLHMQGACKEFDTTEIEQKRFQTQYIWLWNCYMHDMITFETYTAEALFRKFFD